VQASLVEKTMNAEERSLIADSENMNLAFTRLWTKKEAYLKMKGTGIIADLKTTLEDMDPTKVVIDTLEYIDKGYVLSLAHASVDTDGLS
jgi:4'-phosphopantetheinyl transferase